MVPIKRKLWLASHLLLLITSLNAWSLREPGRLDCQRRHSWLLAATADEGDNKFSPFGRTRIEHGPHQIMKQLNGEKQQKQPSKIPIKSSESDLNVADPKMLKRDRALLALHSNLKMDMVDAINLLEKFPELYLDCPSLATRILYLLQELGLSKKKLRHILQVHPRLMVRVLLDDPETNVSSTMELLQTELQMTLEEIMAKKLWQLDRMEMKPRLSFLKETIPSVSDLKTICLKYPNILGGVTVQGSRQTTLSNMKQIVCILQQDELQLSNEQTGEMIRKQPSILSEDPVRVQRQAHFLLHGSVGEGLGMVLRRGVSTQQMDSVDDQKKLVLQRVQELLLTYPVLLTSPNVMVTVDYIIGLGCTTYDLGRIAYRRPKLFQYDVGALQEKVDFFCQQLELAEKLPLLEMMATAPDVFTQSIAANLDPKLQYFRHELGLDAASLRSVFLHRPQILSLRLTDNLIPKIQYLLETFHMNVDDVRAMITRFPQVLRESLETRIQPRCELLMQLGLRCPEQVPLDFIQMTEAQWNAR
jgi:hypothetical protein